MEPKRCQKHIVLGIAKQGLPEEVNSHRAPLESVNGYRTKDL